MGRVIINPQGTIYLLKGVPLSTDNINQIAFPNKTAQFNFFTSKYSAKLFSKYSYIRRSGTVRVEGSADELEQYNYMLFQNKGFSAKWFYAFVISVEYVNNETAEIVFQIDQFQTWFSGVELAPCIIERETVEDDTAYKHILPEGVETGEYYLDEYPAADAAIFKTWYYIFGVTAYYNGSSWVNAPPAIYNGVFSGIAYFILPTYDLARRWLDRYNSDGRGDAIVSISMIPSQFAKYVTDNSSIKYSVINSDEAYRKYYNIKRDTKPFEDYATGEKYTPKNRKLYSSPYRYIGIVNYEGDILKLMYEYFGKDTIRGCLFGTVFPSGSCQFVPEGYMLSEGHNADLNYNYTISTSTFPQCAFATDTYKAWLAQTAATRKVSQQEAEVNAQFINRIQGWEDKKLQAYQGVVSGDGTGNDGWLSQGLNFATGAINDFGSFIGVDNLYGKTIGNAIGLVGGGFGVASGNVNQIAESAAIGSAEGQRAYIRAQQAQISMTKKGADFAISKLLAAESDHSVIPPSAKGNNESNLSVAMRHKGFGFQRFRISVDYAKRIDTYFTMFGYRVDRYGIPDWFQREKFTYIKTTNCNAIPKESGCPNNAIAAIEGIFNSGVRIWQYTEIPENGFYVDYSEIENKPFSEV